MATPTQVTQFISFCLGQYCEHADAVTIVTDEETPSTVVFRITVHADDTPRVIGKGGRTIEALRTLVRSMGAREEKKYLLFLEDTPPAPQQD